MAYHTRGMNMPPGRGGLMPRYVHQR